MVGASNSAGLVPVSDDESRGEAIKRRRKAHRMSVNALAMRADMDWKTVNRAENDHPGTQPETYDWLERKLNEYDHEAGSDLPQISPPAQSAPESHLVRFKLSGNFGVDVVVEGPVENLDELQDSVQKLLRQMQQSPASGQD